MAGIVFLRTAQFEQVVSFYVEQVGMEMWLEQPGIAILRHGNLLVGFHHQPIADLDALLTFYYPTREQVDAMYAAMQDVATTDPKVNEKYQIYNFFGLDPEGRKIEFQQFLHPLPETPIHGFAPEEGARRRHGASAPNSATA